MKEKRQAEDKSINVKKLQFIVHTVNGDVSKTAKIIKRHSGHVSVVSVVNFYDFCGQSFTVIKCISCELIVVIFCSISLLFAVTVRVMIHLREVCSDVMCSRSTRC